MVLLNPKRKLQMDLVYITKMHITCNKYYKIKFDHRKKKTNYLIMYLWLGSTNIKDMHAQNPESQRSGIIIGMVTLYLQLNFI